MPNSYKGVISVKTLTVQLIDAKPDRIRICRIDGESLVTVVIPREDLAEAKSLPNIPQRGVYYLLDEDHGNVSREGVLEQGRHVPR